VSGRMVDNHRYDLRHPAGLIGEARARDDLPDASRCSFTAKAVVYLEAADNSHA
jgi:hypothetical protein